MKTNIFILLFLGILFFSCNSSSQKTGSSEVVDTTNQVIETATQAEEKEEENKLSESQKTEFVAAIDAQRQTIEEAIKDIKPIELKTEGLRPQIKQKWEKIHYYVSNDSVLRIKTYPYKNISTRTEEFYFQAGDLILAVIEDNGTAEADKENSDFDKLYYYKDDKHIHEINNSGETEYSAEKFHAERLMEEAKEYVELLPKQ